ncbi:MAG: hypothetical protein RKE49_03155 [Oceanicaulis sp.]
MSDKTSMHEPDAVPVRNIFLFTLVPAIAISACLIALFAFFVSETDAVTAQEAWDRRPGEGPRLSARPAEAREAIEMRDAAWLERGPGIELAMAAAAEAGWRDGGWPSRAYEALEMDAATVGTRTSPRESDLRAPATGPRADGDREPRAGANAEPETRTGEGPP